MAEKDKSFEEKKDQLQEPALEVTELDDKDLEDASGGTFNQEEVSVNENCHSC